MADGVYITPSDRDYVIRTVLGEAGNQPDEGQAAVAHVIMNRVNRGYGKSPTDVVFAPNQFEPWSTRRNELLGYSPDSPSYKKAAAIVDDVIGNKIKDPTNGATHFLQEDIVRKRRGGSLPDWASGGGLKIGDHTFFQPDESGRAEPKQASVIDKYRKGAAPSLDSNTQSSPPLEEGLSIIDKYRKKPQTLAVPEIDPRLPKPGEPVTPKSEIEPQWQRDLKQVGGDLLAAPGNFLKSGLNNIREGVQQIGEGGADIVRGDVLPTGFGKPPLERKPGGALRIGAGVLQTLGGATGATPTTEALESGVTNVTGNPTAGAAAGLVGNALVTGQWTRAGNRLRPSVRAEENIGGVPMTSDELKRLSDNPRLRPIDVNPSLHGKGLGLSVDEGPAKDIMYNRAKQHAEATPQAVRDAYTTTIGPPVDPVVELRRMQGETTAHARKGFGEAFRNSKPVDTSPVIAAIDAELKPGITGVTSPNTTVAWGPFERRLAKLRQELTDGSSVVTDPQRLHEIQYTLGREVRDFQKSATGSDRYMGSELGKVQTKLVEQIDKATGGKYQPARAKFKSDKEIEDAYGEGFNVVQNRPGLKGALEDSPTAWREWIQGRQNSKGQTVGKATTEEIEAAKLGARAAIEHEILRTREHARSPGMNIADIPYNQQKLEILFGKPEASRLVRLMKDERDMAYTNNKLIHNSTTAEKTANAASVRPRGLHEPLNFEKTMFPAVAGAAEYGLTGGFSGIGPAAAIAARHVANRLGRRSDLARNEIMADLLSQGGGPQGLMRSQQTAQAGNKLFTMQPAVPFTYTPEDYRPKKVPLAKD